jgi:hypothetical protein
MHAQSSPQSVKGTTSRTISARLTVLAIQITIGLVLAALFAWYAHARITIRPPLTLEELQAAYGPPAESESTRAVRELREWLTQPVPFQAPPAPPGMQWEWFGGWPPDTLNISIALDGEWVPDQRPQLAAISAWLASAETQRRLDRMQDYRGQPWVRHIDRARSMWRALQQDRALSFTIAADARRQWEGSGDAAAAWDRLETLIWLSDTLQPEAPMSLTQAEFLAAYAYAELYHMFRGAQVDPTLAARIDTALRSEPDYEDCFQRACLADRDHLLALMDTLYTRDADGNGWLSLSAQGQHLSLQRSFGRRPPTRSAWWNLFSGVYNDRRMVAQKIRAYYASGIDLAGQPINALRVLPSGDSALSQINTLDGLWLNLQPDWFYGLRLHQLESFTMRRGLRIVLALERYAQQTGAYPDTLATLMPDYIAALPQDPLTEGPFVYRRDDPTYHLYSRGLDQDDDGGTGVIHRDMGWPDNVDYPICRSRNSAIPLAKPVPDPSAPTPGAGQ